MKNFSSKLNPIALTQLPILLDKLLSKNESILLLDGSMAIGGNSYIKSTVNFDYEIFKNNHVNFTANYANIGEDIFETVNWISIPRISGYAIGYGLETAIGPIEIKRSWSPETKNGYTWFSVGFPF